MKIKLIFTGLLLSSLNSYAYSHDSEFEKFYSRNGLPKPNSGLTIINTNKNKNALFSVNNNIKNPKGYLESDQDNLYIYHMLEKGSSSYTYSEPDEKNVRSHKMRKDFHNIKFNKEFKMVPNNGSEKIIGYEAGGVFNDGWTNGGVYFKNEDLGVCSLQSMRINSVQINSEYHSYSVNGKSTAIKLPRGNPKYGFEYEFTWFDVKKNHILGYEFTCVTREFDGNHINKMINYARSIDSQIG